MMGTNRFMCNDLSIKSGLNMDILSMTLLISNYENGPNPSVYIESMKDLSFIENNVLSGGNIYVYGKESIYTEGISSFFSAV